MVHRFGSAIYSVNIPGTLKFNCDGLDYTELNTRAIEGLAQIESKTEWGTYRSRLMKDPTWAQLLVAAHEQIVSTDDHHHVFLEGIEEVTSYGDDFKIRVFRLVMGS